MILPHKRQSHIVPIILLLFVLVLAVPDAFLLLLLIRVRYVSDRVLRWGPRQSPALLLCVSEVLVGIERTRPLGGLLLAQVLRECATAAWRYEELLLRLLRRVGGGRGVAGRRGRAVREGPWRHGAELHLVELRVREGVRKQLGAMIVEDLFKD